MSCCLGGLKDLDSSLLLCLSVVLKFNGQEMSLFGSLSSDGFSKQPRLPPPNASSASTGYRLSKSEANVQASSQTRSKGHF